MRGVLRMHHAAAVHVDRLPCHFSRSGTAQKDDHCRDIVRLLPASKRNHLMNLVRCPVFISPAFLRRLLVVPRFPDRFIQRRPDHSRTNGIDAHSGCREILRHALSKIDIRRFAGNAKVQIQSPSNFIRRTERCFPLLFTDRVQKFVGSEQQACSIDGETAVEDAAIVEIIRGEHFKFRLRCHDECAAFARGVINSSVGKQGRGIDLSGAIHAFFMDNLASVGLCTECNPKIVVHPVEMSVMKDR